MVYEFLKSTLWRYSAIAKVARSGLDLMFRLSHRDKRIVRHSIAPGITVDIYPAGQLAAFLWLGSVFESEELRLVASILRPGMRVIDVGANIGLYSLMAARCIGLTGQIWSFEPSGETFQLLLRNLALNAAGTVAPYQLALSDAEGELVLRSEPGFGDAYRYLDYRAQRSADERSETVRVTTLDAFAAENDIKKIDFLKVDVEGAEYYVLKGAQRLLAASPNAIIMFESEAEWCERAGCTREAAFDVLRGLGFHLVFWSKQKQEWLTDAAEVKDTRTVWAVRDIDLLNPRLQNLRSHSEEPIPGSMTV